jgi:hypothetical protein
MTFELDVVIDTNPAHAPFGKAIGLRRQRVEVGPVELFEERPAGDTEVPDRAFVVELLQQLTDRRIEFGQAVEAPVAQAAEQPSLDGQYRDFHRRLVAHCRLLIVRVTSSRIRITHPFHPQSGREFELVCRRRHWSEDRVPYLDDDGCARSQPI